MEKNIQELVSKILRISIEKVTDDLTMKGVDTWDSLKHMELIVSFEELYKIQFTFEEIITMQSIGEIKRVLEKKGVVV